MDKNLKSLAKFTSMLLHKDIPVISFKDEKEFDTWLKVNHQKDQAFWLRYYKKGSGLPSILPTHAVDVALCWGWIDGLINAYDDISYLVRFTPRRPKSIWSKVNVAKVEKLIAAKRMQPSGLHQVNLAKADGRWDRAYEPASSMKLSDEFLKMVEKNKKALAVFKQMNKAQIYAIAFKLHHIQDEKKKKTRMNEIVDSLKAGNQIKSII